MNYLYTMRMNTEFKKFVESQGSVQVVADLLECTDSMVGHLRHGRRGISKQVARKIVDKFPEYSLYRLLYGDDQ